MKQAAKNPPPDSCLNLQGRMYQLQLQAHVRAVGGIVIIVAEEGHNPKQDKPYAAVPLSPQEYASRLAMELKSLAPEFKSLEQRLLSCEGSAVATAIFQSPSQDSQMPLSREKALEKGIASSESSHALLDFMQSTLDS